MCIIIYVGFVVDPIKKKQNRNLGCFTENTEFCFVADGRNRTIVVGAHGETIYATIFSFSLFFFC